VWDGVTTKNKNMLLIDDDPSLMPRTVPWPAAIVVRPFQRLLQEKDRESGPVLGLLSPREHRVAYQGLKNYKRLISQLLVLDQCVRC
jgi:hypothetical protein